MFVQCQRNKAFRDFQIKIENIFKNFSFTLLQSRKKLRHSERSEESMNFKA